MNEYQTRGKELRKIAKEIVLDFMNSCHECQKNNLGISLASLFRECGFDWGDYTNATSSNQQYWAVALIRELEEEGKVIRLESKKWILT